ncbi:hypothetical protein CM49_04799 [Paenibacillus sp. P1XP2]|nr:hypothetical protein CM49_04799 [Paenibacillus sp. P1XP2]
MAFPLILRYGSFELGSAIWDHIVILIFSLPAAADVPWFSESPLFPQAAVVRTLGTLSFHGTWNIIAFSLKMMTVGNEGTGALAP